MLMAAAAGGTASDLGAQVARRWQAIDPLLPAPADPPPGCGAELSVAGPGGPPVATGICEHWQGEPGSLALAWGPARRFQLSIRSAGPGVTGALDELLLRWRDHLARVPGADGGDTAAVVTWPSRDIGGFGPLLRRGFAPLIVIAARTAGRRPGRPPRPGDGGGAAGPGPSALRIRRAGPGDIDAVVRLGAEAIRYDGRVLGLPDRPGTAGALWREAAAVLAAPDTWTWLAERDGVAIGMAYAERPEAAAWIAPMVRLAPVAYLMLAGVVPGERGHGVGAALAAELHREIDAAGVAVTLLHHGLINPLSAPFWSQQGYRPLWTSWEARPARAIR
jgi:GNAT superfamily N-acetyltransferase